MKRCGAVRYESGKPRSEHRTPAVAAILAVAALIASISGCSPPASRETPAVVRAFVSVMPQAGIVERIGGSRVRVDVLVGPGQSAHVYEPTPQQVARLSEAQVYFQIGLEFEEILLARLQDTLRTLRVVDTRAGITLRRDPCTHADHEHDAPHEHGRADPHIWLAPRLIALQARTIRDELARLAPEHTPEFDANLQAFVQELDALDARIRTRLAPHRGGRLFVYHPTYGYFCDAYGLTQVPIEREGKEPSARELAELVGAARAAGVRAVFHEPQYPRAGVDALAGAISARVIVFDPLRRDVVAGIGELAELVHGALQPAASAPGSGG